LRGDFFTLEDLSQVEICAQALSQIEGNSGKIHRSTFIRRFIRNLLAQLVSDTQKNIVDHNIETLADVQHDRSFFRRIYPGTT